MANRSKGGRGRSRKRRSAGRAKAAVAGATEAAQGGQASPGGSPPASGAAAAKGTGGGRSGRRPRERHRAGAARPADGYRAPGSVGERPRAPWHPLPLAELSILVGLVAVAIGAARGEAGKTLLLVGVLVVVFGTLDTTIREHLSGYRSHAGLLAAVPTALVHGGIALGLFALGAPRVTWVLVPIVVDVPMFSLLLKLLRARFEDARRERVFTGRS
ncbi:MAG TPA: hypothetical protein VGI27_02870 [Solirubrobacteraceae bacterium]